MKWWSFILGAIVGWVVSWLLELFYWRWKRQARIAELEAQLRGCHDQLVILAA